MLVAYSVLLDTWQQFFLVSYLFLVNSLNISRKDIRASDVLVKGVSGNVFKATGEVDLSFLLFGNCFKYSFVVLENRSFPVDLLLSYTSIKFFFPECALLSLAISDSSRLSNKDQFDN